MCVRCSEVEEEEEEVGGGGEGKEKHCKSASKQALAVCLDVMKGRL